MPGLSVVIPSTNKKEMYILAQPRHLDSVKPAYDRIEKQTTSSGFEMITITFSKAKPVQDTFATLDAATSMVREVANKKRHLGQGLFQ